MSVRPAPGGLQDGLSRGIGPRAVRLLLPPLFILAAIALAFAGGGAAAVPDGSSPDANRLLPGDLNDDAKINIQDYLLLKDFLSGSRTASGIDAVQADVNGDGVVDALDLANLQFMAGVYRGELLSRTKVGTLTKSASDWALLFMGLPEFRPSRWDAGLYKITYRTVGVDGYPTVASGLLALPEGRSASLPLISVSHGTETRKEDVPSNPSYAFAQGAEAVFVCSGGYAAVGADFIGLGDSPGMHPFIHALTEATAGADMLRAGKKACQDIGRALSGQLFVAGYSQGGHVAMALHRELQEEHAGEFTVTASAPMAGPYDVSGTMLPALLADETPGSPFVAYLPYALLSWRLAYGIIPSLSEAVKAPYDAQLPGLFDMYHTSGQIIAALPPVAHDLLQPEFLAALLSDPDHPVNAAARENDVYNWKPLSPMRLYHGKADTTVPYANSEVANARMSELGGTVTLVNLGDTLDHSTAVIPALRACRLWFDSLLTRAAAGR